MVRTRALLALTTLVGACGSREIELISLPDDIEWIALLVPRDAARSLSPENLAGATELMVRDEVALTLEETSVLVGWGSRDLEELVSKARGPLDGPLRIPTDSDPNEPLPPPRWKALISLEDPAPRETEVPALTASWMPESPRWARVVEGPAPEGRLMFRLSVDEPRERAVLFGGLSKPYDQKIASQAEFGESWTLLEPAEQPSPRMEAALAYLPRLGGTVLFGGSDISRYQDDTWLWDGARWSRLSPASAPPGRRGHRMVYDPIRDSIILFGGITNGGLVNDTWSFDGSTWTELQTSRAPELRESFGMFFHAERGTVVVLGGAAPGLVYGDAWELVGSTWREARELDLPGGRSGFALAYAPTSSQMFLHGGWDEQGQSSSSLLIFAEGWSVAPSQLGSPEGRVHSEMVFLPWSRSLLLFGGASGVSLDSDETHTLKLE